MMESMYATEGIVLKKIDVGENDGVFILYTRDFGKGDGVFI